VEFSLPPDLAEIVYRRAATEGLSLSQTGTQLLAYALENIPTHEIPGRSASFEAKRVKGEPQRD